MVASRSEPPAIADLPASAIAGTSMVLSGAVAFMGITTAEVLYLGYSVRQDVSDLGSTPPPDPIVHQPSATIFDGTMLLTGALLLVAAYVVYRAGGRRVLFVPLAVFGFGVFPGNVTPWHGLFALLTFASGGVTAVRSSRVVSRPFSWLCVLVVQLDGRVLFDRSREEDHVDGVAARAAHDVARVPEVGVDAEPFDDLDLDVRLLPGDAVSGIFGCFVRVEPPTRPEPVALDRLVRSPRDEDAAVVSEDDLDAHPGEVLDELGEGLLRGRGGGSWTWRRDPTAYDPGRRRLQPGR